MLAQHFIRFTLSFAIKLMSLMHCRLFLVFFLAVTTFAAYADSDLWSCQQNETNEWVCVGGATPASETSAESPSTEGVVEEPKPSAKATEPDSIPSEVAVPPRQAVPKFVVTPPATTSPVIVQENKHVKPAQNNAAMPQASFTQPTCKSGSSCQTANKKFTSEPFEAIGQRVLGPVFDPREEQIFSNLYNQLKADPWASCMVQRGTQRSWGADTNLRKQTPLDVKSNYSEIFDNEIGNYVGNVEMHRADQHALSHAANYDSISETLDLQGDVYYSEDEIALHSNTATLKLASDQASLRDLLFIFPATPLRGRAKVAYRDSKYLSHYKDVSYTTCRPGNQDWAMHASELKLNKFTGKGAAKNAWIEFKGTPVFYMPYYSFPIDNRRLSGFLAPSYHYTQRSGFSLAIPYYWNIAPNYDATFSPRYLTKRGVLLGGEFRYLTEGSNGIANLEYLPNDQITNDSRYQGSYKHTTQFTSNLNANLDLNYVSDKNYFAELGNSLSFPNFSFLKSQADVNYVQEGITLSGRVESYQTVDPALTGLQIPYRRLPQINLNLNHSFNFMPLDVAMENESVYFQHTSLINGQRFNIKPSVSFPLQTVSAYLTPKISIQHTQYLLENPKPGLPNDISRTSPITSVDTGLFLERSLEIANTPLTHTLEPRLFYLYIPKTDQSNIPVFDTSLYDFWYSSMFRENRFSGSDRVQDANQVTVALSSRLLDPETGRERLKLNIGEIFYFRNREVTLCGTYPATYCSLSPVETDSSSPLVTELSSELSEHYSIDAGLQWNPHNNKIARGKFTLHYINQPDQLINLGFLYRQNPLVPNQSNDITQSDFSFRWPIYNNWYAVGRWQYSWLYNQTQDGFFGLEKENCCWRFRLIGRQYLNSIYSLNSVDALAANNIVEGTSQTGLFFQIELKGFTGVGEKLDDFFEKSIYGYQKPNS